MKFWVWNAKMTPETIVAAAVRIPVQEEFRTVLHDGQRVYPDYLIVSAPPPARHFTLMHPIWEAYSVSIEDQGFLTSTGRYVGREEGLKIAVASGQQMIDHPSRNDKELFSEDLW